VKRDEEGEVTLWIWKNWITRCSVVYAMSIWMLQCWSECVDIHVRDECLLSVVCCLLSLLLLLFFFCIGMLCGLGSSGVYDGETACDSMVVLVVVV